MNVLTNIAYFLIDTLFSLYIIVVVVRFLLGLVKADFYNPISQFLVAATNPLLIPMRRFIPSFGKIDTAALVLILVLKLAQVSLLLLISGESAGFGFIIIYALLKLLELVIYVFIFALIIQAVISWVNPGAHNPMTSLLHSLTRPLLQPLSRHVPPIGMVDITPLVAILLLNILLIVLRSLFPFS